MCSKLQEPSKYEEEEEEEGGGNIEQGGMLMLQHDQPGLHDFWNLVSGIYSHSVNKRISQIGPRIDTVDTHVIMRPQPLGQRGNAPVLPAGSLPPDTPRFIRQHLPQQSAQPRSAKANAVNPCLTMLSKALGTNTRADSDHHETEQSTYGEEEAPEEEAPGEEAPVEDTPEVTFDPAWNQGKCFKRRLFLAELGKALVTPLIQRRQHLPRTPASCSLRKAGAEEEREIMERKRWRWRGGRSGPRSDVGTDQSAACLGLSRRSSRAGLEDASAGRDPRTRTAWARLVLPAAHTHAYTLTGGRKGVSIGFSASSAVQLCPGEDDSSGRRAVKQGRWTRRKKMRG
ncbi:unnamed protein product [Pleuronectes platessa]|uniref:Uncharacterized protein n=1 Tax=Pleuronectes platessa TaxID=8262 RepID=A0A9N7YXB8_PLEPL|nr:unnamed protein product [Pleuronectes platessa]